MRPRESYLLHGATELGDNELLALMIGTGVSGQSVSNIAATVLDTFGSTLGLAHAPPRSLARVKGVGEARAVRLHAALQLGLRAGRSLPHPGPPPLASPAAAAAWFVPRFRGLLVEEVHALFLDRRGRPMEVRRLSSGTDHYAVLEPALVLRPAVQLGAAQVVLAHNHPSGDPEPSGDDIRLTDVIRQAGEVVRVRLVDHLVIGGEHWVSLASRAAR